MSDIEGIDAPSNRGWPKGKPRKPVLETPDAFLDSMRQSVEADRERMEAANPARSAQRGEQRLAREKQSDDKFHIDDRIIPDGMSYEWKRRTYAGKVDQSHMAEQMRQHWTPVPSERHPTMAWTESTSKYIEKEGLVLMERPAYLTKEAHAERVASANGNIEAQVKRLMGTAREKQFDKPAVKTGYDLQIGDDE